MLQRFGLGLAAAGTILSWASAFVLVRVAVVHLGPASLAFLRFAVASLVVGAWIVVRGARDRRHRLVPLRRADALATGLMGFFGITVYHVALNAGEQTVPAGTASLIINTGPVWVALIGYFVLAESLRWRGWLGLVVAMVGATTLTVDELEHTASASGLALILVAAIAQSIQFVLARRLVPHYGSVTVTAYTFWIGTVPLVAAAPAAWRELVAAPRPVVWAVVYLALFPSAIAYGLWAFVLRRVPTVRASAWLLLIPVVAVGMGVVFLDERFSGLAVVSALVTVVGLILMRGQQRAR